MALVGTLALTYSIPATALAPMPGMVGGQPQRTDVQALELNGTYTPGEVVRDDYTIDRAWTLPLAGRISSPFGSRPTRPVDGVGAFHYGTDIVGSCGAPVYAAASGTVEEAGWQGTYGKWVLLDNGGGVETGYAHNSQVLVSPGDDVKAGDVIALVGSTGASTGCHVHVEVRQSGKRIDAQPFMQARGVTLG